MVTEFNEEKQNRRLAELRKKEEEDLAQLLSSKYAIDYLDLSTVSINTDALRLLSEKEAREANVAPFTKVGSNIGIAFLSPGTEKAQNIKKRLEQKGLVVTPYIVSKRSLEWVWRRYKDITETSEVHAGVLDISSTDIVKIATEVSTTKDVRAKIEGVLAEKKGYRISHIVEIIVAGALALKASDIHLEPEEKEVRLRYRLDGVLTDITLLDTDTYRLLLSRIKLLSGLKLNVSAQAQDGRFSITLSDELEIEIRTSILPGAYNESVVLRILDPRSLGVQLEDLGMRPDLLARIEKELHRPNGMILTTGPTGSGKTTTLYSFLKKIHTPNIKIITIEDPIEYHIAGIVQTQVDKKKYTFANGLRSALRQDPDVIMVGEIRDNEAADIAINASLTGHLVFSTLHTNSAAGAFPRLIDIGINAKILSSAVTTVIAQRLVRKLCPDCKREVSITPEIKEKFMEVFETSAAKDALPQLEHMWEAAGCSTCDHSGYKGRIGIYEAIFMSPKLEELLRENPSSRDIENLMLGENFVSMKEDGVIKILSGITSLSELERVVTLDA